MDLTQTYVSFSQKEFALWISLQSVPTIQYIECLLLSHSNRYTHHLDVPRRVQDLDPEKAAVEGPVNIYQFHQKECSPWISYTTMPIVQ